MRETVYWQDSVLKLDSLMIYRGILQDEVVRKFTMLLEMLAGSERNTDARYREFVNTLVAKACELGLSGNILSKYLIWLFLRDENSFTLACERGEPVEKSSLYEMVLKDLEVLHYFCEFDLKNLCSMVGSGEKLANFVPIVSREDGYLGEVLQASSAKNKMRLLQGYYNGLGAGDMASYHMFKLDDENGKLIGIEFPDTVTFKNIFVYERQKQMLKDNIEAFLAGQPTNNVLLTGSRGNGKSSCVKALVNGYRDKGLRLIEVRKDQAVLLPKLIDHLAGRGLYFLIYMDDLSYDHFETQYKYLKSLLEGGAGIKPPNVVFFATSNRRHIVHESWGDRETNTEEIHAMDTVNEKMSLYDRFGLTVHFPNLSQEEYLKIVQGIAHKHKITIDEDFLNSQALQWAMEQKCISGRTAVQFIHHIMWELTKS